MMGLKFEICISTMGNNIPTWVNEHYGEKILIINQTDFEQEYSINENIKIVCSKERGLSKSRNLAIKKSSADFLIISDNDNEFDLKSAKAFIERAHNSKNAAYIINDQKKLFHQWAHKKLNYRDIMRIASWQIILNKKFLQENCIKFDENFGLGSKYNHGEENILLSDILRAKGEIIATGVSGVMHPDLGTGYHFNIDLIKTKWRIFIRMFGAYKGPTIFIVFLIKNFYKIYNAK